MAERATKKASDKSDEIPPPPEGLTREETKSVEKRRKLRADVVFGFFLPTLAGNVFGGTLLFAVLSYAQVREEIE